VGSPPVVSPFSRWVVTVGGSATNLDSIVRGDANGGNLLITKGSRVLAKSNRRASTTISITSSAAPRDGDKHEEGSTRDDPSRSEIDELERCRSSRRSEYTSWQEEWCGSSCRCKKKPFVNINTPRKAANRDKSGTWAMLDVDCSVLCVL